MTVILAKKEVERPVLIFDRNVFMDSVSNIMYRFDYEYATDNRAEPLPVLARGAGTLFNADLAFGGDLELQPDKGGNDG
jgi:hypothetical protein